jgi:predicted transglutaminase-like cysteine proteinase
MPVQWQKLVGAVSLCAALASPALANLPPDDTYTWTQRPFIALGARVLEPFAEVIFCHHNPAECVRGDGVASLEMTPALMLQLTAVNRMVNRSIAPKEDDPNIMGGNVWRLAPREGDCKDYAITKRHELMARGLSASALRLAIVHTMGGEGHMVLVVTTSSGDVVLDNLTSEIRKWRDARLTWQMIQSADDPRQWFSVDAAPRQLAEITPPAAPAWPVLPEIGNVWDFV